MGDIRTKIPGFMPVRTDCRRAHGQLNPKFCALAVLRGKGELTLMPIDDDLVTEGHANARALADGFGGEEFLKYPRLNRLGDAWPIIGDRNHHCASTTAVFTVITGAARSPALGTAYSSSNASIAFAKIFMNTWLSWPA